MVEEKKVRFCLQITLSVRDNPKPGKIYAANRSRRGLKASPRETSQEQRDREHSHSQTILDSTKGSASPSRQWIVVGENKFS